jgi:NAD(P)-dependent dehydrogenase (short-subunit alcohol dehydrogenase family)
MKRALKLLKPAAITGAALTGAGIAGAIAGGTILTALAVRKLTAKPVPDGAVVVITGGSRGLGFAIASRFAKGHVRLVLAARDRDELERAQASLLSRHPHLSPDDFYLVAADLMSTPECDRLIAEAIARFGRVDVLVNNAGIIGVGPLEAQTPERFEDAMRLMFFAGLYTTWSALPHMLRQQPLTGAIRARIVNISSIGGKIAVPHMLPYTAAKFAMTGFSEGLHAELRHKGVRVTTVCPGLMRTGGEDHAHFYGDADAEAKWFKFMAKTPGISTSVEHAANVIYRAVSHGCAEVTITPQAMLAARFGGLCPESLQLANALANRYLLPSAPQR